MTRPIHWHPRAFAKPVADHYVGRYQQPVAHEPEPQAELVVVPTHAVQPYVPAARRVENIAPGSQAAARQNQRRKGTAAQHVVPANVEVRAAKGQAEPGRLPLTHSFHPWRCRRYSWIRNQRLERPPP